MRFQRERLSEALFVEVKPLIYAHWQEICPHPDIALDPDYPMYMAADAAGMFRVYTARVDDRLIGYCGFFLRNNLQSRQSLQATQDTLFLTPEFRRGYNGYRFIEWCDDQLREEGVQLVYQHVNIANDFGVILERIGYHLIDKVYGRRLDKTSGGG